MCNARKVALHVMVMVMQFHVMVMVMMCITLHYMYFGLLKVTSEAYDLDYVWYIGKYCKITLEN